MPRRNRPSTRRLTVRVAALSAALTLTVGGGLALQMAEGHDPALGSKPVATTKTTAAPQTSSATSGATVDGETGEQGYDDYGYYGYAQQPQQQASTPAPVTSTTS